MGNADALEQLISARRATVAVIGLGYVGLPLVLALVKAGFRAIGVDVDPKKIEMLERGETYIRHLPGGPFQEMIFADQLHVTGKFEELRRADAILICVPTPLTRNRDPDLSFIISTAQSISPHLRAGQLIVLESTTYPGTTCEVLRPILEDRGKKSGQDFFLAFSPEREDPGNPHFTTTSMPKVVGGDGGDALRLASVLYQQIVPEVVPVSSPETAEAVKITENIFRAVNIALVNELKILFSAMNIDVWEVIEAAKTKPFGYMPFYPGPGLGGHCIPIDPFYLTWKARAYDMPTRFIELAGEINASMPGIVVNKVSDELSTRFAKSVAGSHGLVVGLAYKKNVDDIRESPSFRLIELLERKGATTDYYDPFVPQIPHTREHSSLAGRNSIEFTAESLRKYDFALIVTDHDGVDYDLLVENSRLVVDTRNAVARLAKRSSGNVCKA